FFHSHLPQPPMVFRPSTKARKIGRRIFSHIHFAPAWIPFHAGLIAVFHSHLALSPIHWNAGLNALVHSHNAPAAILSKAGFRALFHSHLPIQPSSLIAAMIGRRTMVTRAVSRIFPARTIASHAGLIAFCHSQVAHWPTFLSAATIPSNAGFNATFH